MKSLLSLVIITLCVSAQAAKEEVEVNVVNEYVTNFGAQVGLNISDASVAAGASSSRAGFQLGVLGETPVTPGLLYLQPEFSFVQRGAENANFGLPVKVRLNYLEAGLLLKAKVNMADAKPFVMAGPRLGYLLNASGEAPGLTLGRSNFRSFDIGFDIGGGMAIAMNSRSEVIVSARYGFGILDADSSAGEWKSDSFLISVGYLF